MSFFIQHRNRIVWVTLFLALVWAGDRVGARILDRAIMSTGFRYAELYKGGLAAEIVILGNSRGLHMFHPPAIREAAGREAANISYNALPTVLMPVLWSDYLSHQLKNHQTPPKRLIFEVSCVGREDEPGSLERFKVFMFHSEPLSQAIAKHFPKEYVASRVSHLYRFNSELTLRSMFFRGKSDQDWIMTEHVTDDQIERVLDRDPDKFLRDQQNVIAAKEVLAVAKGMGVQVDLIVAPYHPRYRETLTELPDWIQWLSGELDCPIHDYSQSISETSGFADHLHLNPDGARQLAEILDRDGIL